MTEYVTIKLEKEYGAMLDKHRRQSDIPYSSRANCLKHILRQFFKENGAGGNGGTSNTSSSSSATQQEQGEKNNV